MPRKPNPLSDPDLLAEFTALVKKLAAARNPPVRHTALHGLIGLSPTQWSLALDGKRSLNFNEVARLASAVGASGVEFDRLFEMNDIDLSLAGASRTGREETHSAIRSLQNELSALRRGQASETEIELMLSVWVGTLEAAATRPLPRALDTIDGLLLMVTGRSGELPQFLRSLLLQERETLEVHALWPGFNPGAQDEAGNTGMMLPPWGRPTEDAEALATAQKVMEIADRYLAMTREFDGKSRAYETLFRFSAGILGMACRVVTDGSDEAMASALNAHLAKIGASAKVSKEKSTL